MIDASAAPAPILTQLDLDPAFCAWATTHRNLRSAWNSCLRAEWLIALATRVGVDRRLLVATACECAELAAHWAGIEQPRALRLARQWIGSSSDAAGCWAAGFRAVQSADSLGPCAAAATRAAAAAAFACDSEADDSYYASRAHPAEAVSLAAASDVGLALPLLTVVRERISFDVVADALRDTLRSSEIPPGRPSLERSQDVHAIPTGSPRTFTRLR